MSASPYPSGTYSGKGTLVETYEWEASPAESRFNIVIVGDGFLGTTEELDRFKAAAETMRTHILGTAPFGDVRCALKFHRITYTSDNSLYGIDVTAHTTNPTSGTMFGADFWSHGIDRACTVDFDMVLSTVGGRAPEYDRIIVIVNSTYYAASQKGHVAVTTLHPDCLEIVMHELAHTFELGEEYPFELGCGLDTDRDQYPATLGDPSDHNLTKDPHAAGKWADLLTETTPTTTMTGGTCTCASCDYDYGYYDAAGAWVQVCQETHPGTFRIDQVGTFEGAGCYHCGLYRPVYDCKMRTLGAELCPVCQRAIRRELEPLMPSLSCPAPVFEPVTGWQALLTRAVLKVWAWCLDLVGRDCEALQAQFRADHLETGNDDPCIDLPESE